MDKLYYVVCDDKDTTLFEGRYQGRTRGGALKFLKQSIGRKTLNGLVFTITEIPVPLIREIVAEILASGDVTPAANVVPITRPEPEPTVTRFDAFADATEPEVTPPAPEATPSKAKPKTRANNKPAASEAKVGNPGHGDELWSQVRAHWEECRSISQTAAQFGLSPNSVKTRARRENWKQGVTA
jgi:hypothetical protein